MVEKVVRLVQYTWVNWAATWEEELRSGVVVPQYEKGDPDDLGNYRG